MSSHPRISEVRFYGGAVTVELSNGESYEADTAEQIEAIADASMHTVSEIREAIDNANPYDAE